MPRPIRVPLAALSLLAVVSSLQPATALDYQAVVGRARPVSGVSPFTRDCSGTSQHYWGTEVEPQVAVNPADPNHVIAAWIQDRFESHGGGQSNGVAVSRDGGMTWTRHTIGGISRCTGGPWSRATDPWVTISPNGTAYLASLSMNGQLGPSWDRNALTVVRSTDGGSSWDAPVVVVEDPAINLNDKEAITADPTRPENAYLVWAKFLGGTYPAIFVARTTDNGATWDPGVPTGAAGQGNEILVTPDGTVHNFYASGSIFVISSTDQGLTWSRPSRVAFAGDSDARTRDGHDVRAGESIPAFDAGADGSLVAVWSERTEPPTVERIAFTRSTDGGATWTEPASVTGPRAVRPFTPSVAIAGDGTIGVSYYDMRNDRTAGGPVTTDAWFAWSRDGGATWNEEHIGGPFDLLRAPYASGYFLGDYEGLAAGENTFQAIFAMAPAVGRAPITDIYSVPIRIAPAPRVLGGVRHQPRPLPATGVPAPAALGAVLFAAAAFGRRLLARR